MCPMSTVDGYEHSGPLAGSAIQRTKITRRRPRKLFTQVQPRPTGQYTIPTISPRTWPIHYTDGSERSGHETTNSRSTFGARRAAERKLAARRAASTTTQVGRRAVRASGQNAAQPSRAAGRRPLWPRAARFGVGFARGRVRRVGRRRRQIPG